MKRRIEKEITELEWARDNFKRIGEKNVAWTYLYYLEVIYGTKSRLGRWWERRKYVTKVGAIRDYWPIAQRELGLTIEA